MEPLAERVSLALRDLLRGIEADGGVTRHYTPTAVVRAEAFTTELLDSSLDGDQVVICISPEDTEDEEATFTDTQTVKVFHVTAAKVHTPAVTNPLDPAYDNGEHPIRETVQSRLEADIKNTLRDVANRKLISDDDPAGLAIHTQVPLTEKGAEDTWHESWAIVFMRVEVQCIVGDTAA